jgi:hypothetical protein
MLPGTGAVAPFIDDPWLGPSHLAREQEAQGGEYHREKKNESLCRLHFVVLLESV